MQDIDGFPMPQPPRAREPPQMDHEASLQSTTDDATVAKYSAVQLHYYDDKYLKHFVRGTPPRKGVIMNRGSYCRVAAMRAAVGAFLQRAGPAQVAGCRISTKYICTLILILQRANVSQYQQGINIYRLYRCRF